MDGVANGNKRDELTDDKRGRAHAEDFFGIICGVGKRRNDDETNDNVDWRIAERGAFERMVRHTHTHNALQGELRSPQEALRDVRLGNFLRRRIAAAGNQFFI